MWYHYKIDYEHGVADMYCRDTKPDDAEDLFHHLAYQCFGIRKSIGRTELWGPNEKENLEEVTMRDDTIMSYLLDKPHQYTTNVHDEAMYVLAHSGGDVIVWSDKDTKIKSEWDD